MIEPTNANSVIESNLSLDLQDLEKELQADALVFVGPLMHPADDAFRDAIESRQQKRDKLVVILETGGGYIEIAERAAQTMRFHYREVEFVIPNYAMSAGTVLVMSGDAFWMDYYSILGPIDPQVERPDGRPVPALGYLAQYERLIEKSKTGDLTTAEMAFLVEKFDPAELYRYEQERDLSITLLEQWLVKYKFKNWVQTETRKLPVDDAMRRARASEIGKALNETHRWHSHSRGLSIEVLRRELKLQIEDFGQKQNLNTKIRKYYRLLSDYMMRRAHSAIVHTPWRYQPFIEG